MDYRKNMSKIQKGITMMRRMLPLPRDVKGETKSGKDQGFGGRRQPGIS
jgi:hypothetical protein